MDGQRLDRWCERGLFGLVISILVFGPLATGAVRPQDYIVIQALTAGLLLLTSIRLWTNPNPRLLLPPITWPILAFLAYVIFRYLIADIEYLARQDMIKVLAGGSLFLVIVTQIQRTEHHHIITLTLLTLAAGIAVYGLYQYLLDYNHVWNFIRPEIYNKRASGTYICPNHFAGFLAMLFPLGISYALTSRFNKRIRILIGILSIFIFGGILSSLSRGGWLATAGAFTVLVVWMLRNPSQRVRALLLIAIIGIVGTVFLQRTTFSDERKDAFRIVDRTEDMRFRLWSPAYDMWIDHLWLGVGPNHYNERFPQYRSRHDQVQASPQRVHNDYLNTLADLGVLGAILVALIGLTYFRSVLKTWPALQAASTEATHNRTNEAALLLGGSLGIVALLIHSLVDFNMHIPANALLAAALAALVSTQRRFETDRFGYSPHRTIRASASILLLIGAGYLGTQAWKTNRELHWRNKAEAAKPYTTAHSTALEKAFEIENQNPKTAYDLGELHRLLSWAGSDNYQTHATNALAWFQKAMDLDPWDAYTFMRYGMCLDWLGQHETAGEYFLKAETLDPNGYYTLAHVGWHYIQIENYARAELWFNRSLQTYWIDNPIARSYLEIIKKRRQSMLPTKTTEKTPVPLK